MESAAAEAEPDSDVTESDNEMDVDWGEWELVLPPNDPPPLVLALADASEPIPASLTQLAELPTPEELAMDPYASTYSVSAHWTQKEWSERAATAAPAARGRMPYREAVGRFLFLSWNAGGGARLLPEVLKEKGYHFFAIQEARAEQMLQLEDTHNFVLEGKMHCCPQAAQG